MGRRAKPLHCKYCGSQSVAWKRISGRWKLFTGDEEHNCNAATLGRDAEKEEAMRQAELLRASAQRTTTHATATTQGDDGCATCGYELGTSVPYNNRHCTRCMEYHNATLAKMKEEGSIEEAQVVTNHHEQQQEELLPILAKALKPHLEYNADSILDNINASFRTLAQELNEKIDHSLKTIKVTRVEVSQDQGITYKDAGIQHKLFPKLVKMLSARDHKGHRLNIWISGPAGTGKTSAVEHGAKALDLDYASTGSLTESYKIFGFISPGTGQYVPTPFRKIWEHGGVFLFDDCDGSDPSVLVELNNALANGGCTFPDGYVKRHENCAIVLTANTWGLGATNDYVGRMKQDAAFLDRFVKLYWPIDEDLELATAPIESWTRRVQQVRAKVKEHGLKVLVTPRASYYGAALLNAGLDQDDVEAATLRGAMTPDQWDSVKD